MNKIRYYRKKKGLSMRQLHELTGIHPVSICRYETGKAMPSARNLVKLALALECSVDELIADPKGEKTA